MAGYGMSEEEWNRRRAEIQRKNEVLKRAQEYEKNKQKETKSTYPWLQGKNLTKEDIEKERTERILALGLTPFQFDNIKGNYCILEKGSSTHTEAVLQAFEKMKAEGKPIPKPNENGSILDHESSLFFGITGAIGSLLFQGGGILSALFLGNMFGDITQYKRENKREYNKFVSEWRRRNK